MITYECIEKALFSEETTLKAINLGKSDLSSFNLYFMDVHYFFFGTLIALFFLSNIQLKDLLTNDVSLNSFL
jgi:hypothetical protein